MTTIQNDFNHNGDYSFDILPCDVMQDDPVACGPREGFAGVALGFFDGVHIGHRELIRNLIYECSLLGYEPAVFSMDRYPKTQKGTAGKKKFQGYIHDMNTRMNTLRNLGVERMYIQKFTSAFAALSPLTFLDEVVYKKLKARLIVVGSDFRFGSKASGDVKLLTEWAEQNNVRVIIAEDIRSGGNVVSSTIIREAILSGDMETASHLLGAPYSIHGTVIPGNALGRTVGMPTANIRASKEMILPPYGVYVTRTKVGHDAYFSVTNIGLRPTVNVSDIEPLVETTLLDVELDLYGKEIEVSFLHFIRPECKFGSFLSLIAQMNEDLSVAREWQIYRESLWKVHEQRGIGIWVMPTERFHSCVLNICFSMPADPKRSALNALLSRVLTANCQDYPTRAGLARRLDELYGATFNSYIQREGDWHTVVFNGVAVRSGTDGSRPFHQLAELIIDCIFRPLLDEETGLLDADILEQERRNLLLEIEARKNDRAKYAYDRLIAINCEGSAHGIPTTGDPAELQSITAEELTEAWKALLTDSEVSVNLAGQLELDTIELFKQKLHDLPVNPQRPVRRSGKEPAPFSSLPTREVRESAAIEQVRIEMTYSGLPPYPSYQAEAISVLNSMLGADAHSLLFDVVREQHGLAYSIHSFSLRYLSQICISAGVHAEFLEEAVKDIREQVERLAQGDFSQRIFESSKQLVRSRLLSIADNMEHLLLFKRNSITSGRNLDISDSLRLLEDVSPEDVIRIAKQLRPATTYVLLPEKREEVK